MQVNKRAPLTSVDGVTLTQSGGVVSVATSGIGPTQIASTAVTPGTYGSGTAVPVVTVDQDGRITAASTAAISSTANAVGLKYTYRTDTVGAPASGELKINAANFKVATGLKLSKTDAGGTDRSAILANWEDTLISYRAQVVVRRASDGTTNGFLLTSARTDNGTWLSWVAANGWQTDPPADGDTVYIEVTRVALPNGTQIDQAGASSSLRIVPNALDLGTLNRQTSGTLLVGQGAGTDIQAKAVSGDATLAASGALTLANAGPGATGPIGSATVTPVVTIDAKGRVTALTSATITGQDPFAAEDAGTASTWHHYFPLLFPTSNTTGTYATSGSFVRLAGTAIGTAELKGIITGMGTTGPSNPALDWAAGDKLSVTCKMKVTGFASLAANALAGIEFNEVDQNTSMSKDTTLDAASRRITVGVDSGGVVRIITCDGTTVTSTSTGVTVTSGTAFKVKIVFTKGTNVVVTIDANSSTTVSATLPTRLGDQNLAVKVGSTTPTLDWYGGFGDLYTV